MRSRPKRRVPSAAADEELAVDHLARFRDGDRDAFDAIVADFQDRLIQFFYRLSWDLARAEDLTQTLFLKLLRGAARYRPEGKLSTYLFRIATNLWIDHYRATRPHARVYSLDQALLDGYEPSTDSPTPSARAEAREEKEQLRRNLERLTEPHRLVFELAVYQGLPYADVARVLDIPVGTVKSRMHHTVRALRELMEDRGEARDGNFRGAGPKAVAS
ncbi:MAG: RNA polymerase sigma factor [Planctomycetota bacterium]